ncbi:uncharacterized protein [Palaemon carinicauda]|uniref:uncharacterized protein n=1 Tax=Palaemon carinicauda TaxID=392227 RepID=UPI0035B59300
MSSFSPSSNCQTLQTPCSSFSLSSVSSYSSSSSYSTYHPNYRPLIRRPSPRGQSLRCSRRLFESFKENLPPPLVQSSPKDGKRTVSRDNASKAKISFFIEGLPPRKALRPQFRVLRCLDIGKYPENVDKGRSSFKEPLNDSNLDILRIKSKISEAASKSLADEGKPSSCSSPKPDIDLSIPCIVINDQKWKCEDECATLECEPIRI